MVEEDEFELHRLSPTEDVEKIDLLWNIDCGEAFRQLWTKDEIRLLIKHELELIEELDPVFCFLG